MVNNKLVLKMFLLFILSLIFVLPFVNADTTSGLVAYYTLDADGNDYNLTNNLTNTGAVTFASAGIINKSGSFVSATPSYLRKAGVSSFPTSAGSPFTLNCWYKGTMANGGICGFGEVAAAGQRRQLEIRSSNAFFGGYSAGYDLDTTIKATSNTWTLITFTYDGTTLRSYVNGTAGLTLVVSYAVVDTNFGIGYSGSGVGYGNGQIDEVGVWNRALSQSEINYLYNGGLGNRPFNTSSAVTNASTYAYNVYNNTPINSFCVTNSSSWWCTTTGVLNLTGILTNSSLLHNLTYQSNESSGYLNVTYLNQNLSSAVNKSMAQTAITFVAYEKVSSNLLTNVNFTTSLLTNVTHYMNVQARNVTANKSGYYNLTQTYTPVALSVTSAAITGLYATILNVTATNNITGVSLSNFTYLIRSLNYSWNESGTANGTSALINLINGTYNISISPSGYASNSFIKVINSSLVVNTTYAFYSENSIYFYVYNATSLNPINTTTVNIQLFGPSTYINTTTNGSIFLSSLTPGTYNLTITATGYETAQYTVTVGNNSYQTFSAYLESTTSNSVVFTALDDDTSQPIQGVLTTIEKRVNGTYLVVNSLYTDITGRFELAYETSAVYRFTMAKTTGDPTYVTKQFSLTPIIFTSYDVRLQRSNSASLDVDFAGVSIILTPSEYLNNVTNNISLTIASPLGQLQLMNFTVTRSNNATLIQNSSTNAFGATITARVPIANATFGDTVKVQYGYIDNNGIYRSFDLIYSVAAGVTNATRFNTLGANQFGLPLFDRVIILFFITASAGGLAFVLGGPVTATFVSVLVLSYFGATSFVTWWLIIPSIIIMLILGIWSIK